VNVSQKSRYALKAVLELSFRYGQGPISISQIARAQAIPARFLEAILAQLKRGGFVASRRGNEGGYILARPRPRSRLATFCESCKAAALHSVREPSADRVPAWRGLHLRQVVGTRLCGSGWRIRLDNFQDMTDRYRATMRAKAPTYSI